MEIIKKTQDIKLFIILLLSFIFGNLNCYSQQNAPSEIISVKSNDLEYEKDWEEFNNRELPLWFNRAKFGIFVVWGPYSVPSWMPVRKDGYAEWYWDRLKSGKHPELTEFHKKTYGDKTYEQLAEELTAKLFDPEQWCDLFAKSGAKYVITTANYHDGFAMYPTKYAATKSTDKWNSMKTGPKRDIIGELNDAGNKRGLKMGIYFSLYEWYHPLWLSDKDKYVTDFFHPKFKEVVSKYKPWSVFFDGEWSMSGQKWRSNELAQWLYTESPIKDYVVVNDRWGGSRGINGDVYESEYGYGLWTSPHHPWQEDRGIGESYGYNRNENVEDYESSEDLIRILSKIAGNGGNLILCVGPTADGRIPVIMQDRLLGIGSWLNDNGEAIYDTKANPFWPRTFDWGTITTKSDIMYLHIHDTKKTSISIDGFNRPIKRAYLKSNGQIIPIKYKVKKGKLTLNWPSSANNKAVTILTLVPKNNTKVNKTQRQFTNGKMFLTARAFDFHNTNAKPHYAGYRNRFKVVNWKEQDGYAIATCFIEKPGKYAVKISYTTDAQDKIGSEFIIDINNEVFQHTTIESLENDEFEYPNHKLGEITFAKPGKYSILIKPKKKGTWNGLGFRTFELSPVTEVRN